MDVNTTENVNEEALPGPVTESVAFEQSTGQAYSNDELELIKRFTQSRLEHSDALEFIDLKEYEVPPPAHFYQLSKPCVSIKYPHMTFSMSSVRIFEGIYHVLPVIAKTKPRIAVIPLKEEELASFQWARLKDDRYVNKTISAPGFLDDVFRRMKWSKKMRYKAYGHVVDSERGLVLAFDLEQSTWIPGTYSEYVDKETGEVKKKKDIYLPSQYKNKIGMDYEEYISGHQMNMFQDFPELMNMTYDDVPQEYLEEAEVKVE